MIETITYASQALFLGVALYVAWTTLRNPRRSNYFALAFFALMAIIMATSLILPIVESIAGAVGNTFVAALIPILPYLLLRLASEYSSVRSLVLRASELGLLAAFMLIVYPGVESQSVVAFLVVYFFAVATYASRRFALAATSANGISRMRFQSISIASILLGVALFSVIISELAGGIVSDAVTVSRQLLLMGSALLYFAGFTPPVMLRRAWQEPELRRFLYESREVPRHPETERMVAELERISAETIGAPYASIGLWNEETGKIDFDIASFAPGETIGGKSFAENRPILSLDTVSDDPENREIYAFREAWAVMAAPINTDRGTIGVIALYASNPPIFVEDDLSLLAVLADQIGILLENRNHIQYQADLAAREASTRLKDEFLSLAAHDLKTPLTTILATGQLLERRLAAEDENSPEFRSISRLNRESERLRKLVEGLLDASRIEQGQLVAELEPADLSTLISDVVDRATVFDSHKIVTEITPGITAECDALRIQQVTENLLENARKYSPEGSTITVRLQPAGDMVEFQVTDEGMGIAPEDHAKVFDRYYRTEPAEYRTKQGIGLGLFICKAIIDQHRGTISIDSEPGNGSTFQFAIPIVADKPYPPDEPIPLVSEAQVQEH